MFYNKIADKVLFEPLSKECDELHILSAYATPNMLSWYIKNIHHKTKNPIKIHLIVGMVPFDDLSVSVHQGFQQLISTDLPEEIKSLTCSYVTDKPAEHANLYIWYKKNQPEIAYMGTAQFVQTSFVGKHRQELMTLCDTKEADKYFNNVESRSTYCNFAEIEEYITLHTTHPVLDMENKLVEDINEYNSVVLSLVTKSGDTGIKSGLNWGQRKGREHNQAYIPLPRQISRTGFFPLDKKHFTAITDDHHQLTLRVEQQGNKAIATPVRNSDLGEYFRNRLGLSNGAYVTRQDLERYGRTDVKFTKFDEETFYMDFSV